MSLVVAEVYEALIAAGVPEDKARAAASAIPVARELATKDDIVVLNEDIAKLRAELKVLKFAAFTFGPAILALLVKLVFFP